MRKPNIIFLSIIALAALLPLASHWMNADHDTATPNSVSATVTTARPSSALVQPTEKPVARQSELIAAASSATKQSAKPTTEPTQPEHSADEAHPWHVLPIEAPAAAGEPLAALEEIYLTEGFDSEWAGPLEEDFYRTFETANLAGSDVEQAECRTTLCRFAILHQDIQAQEAFIQAFLESPLLPLINQGAIAHHSQSAADGRVTAVYFLARNELANVNH